MNYEVNGILKKDDEIIIIIGFDNEKNEYILYELKSKYIFQRYNLNPWINNLGYTYYPPEKVDIDIKINIK